MNELITNSYKHAFNGQSSGTITISLLEEDQEIVIDYQDDGSGLNIKEVPQEEFSLGTILVEELSKQIKAKITRFKPSEDHHGFHIEFRFQKG
jgi:two-component sensor histidine kinase